MLMRFNVLFVIIMSQGWVVASRQDITWFLLPVIYTVMVDARYAHSCNKVVAETHTLPQLLLFIKGIGFLGLL